jgi:hypothetical protein
VDIIQTFFLPISAHHFANFSRNVVGDNSGEVDGKKTERGKKINDETKKINVVQKRVARKAEASALCTVVPLFIRLFIKNSTICTNSRLADKTNLR